MNGLKNRVSRIEQNRAGAGGIVVVSRYGPEDDDAIEAARNTADANGSLLVIIQKFTLRRE